METGLTTEEITAIKGILAEEAAVEEAILFGSRAMGNFRAGSDIDITVKGNNLSYSIILSLLVKLESLDLPFTIDLIHYDKISDPALIAHINQKGILLFKRNTP